MGYNYRHSSKLEVAFHAVILVAYFICSSSLSSTQVDVHELKHELAVDNKSGTQC